MDSMLNVQNYSRVKICENVPSIPFSSVAHNSSKIREHFIGL